MRQLQTTQSRVTQPLWLNATSTKDPQRAKAYIADLCLPCDFAAAACKRRHFVKLRGA
jgi:hypothetical protein